MVAAAALLLAVPMLPFLVIPFAWPFLAEQLGVHRVHDIAVSSMLWLVLAGLLAQLKSPARQVGAMQQVVLVSVSLLGTTAITRPATLLGPLTVILLLGIATAFLHPARASVVRLAKRFDRVIAVYALASAVPLGMFAVGQLRLDAPWMPIEAHGGHWTAVASLMIAILALALLSATRPAGWRVPAWSAGCAALLYGIASVALPLMPSSIGPYWGALLAAWGLGLVLLAEVRHRGLSVRAPRPA
jgi:hypothetical protein